MRRTGSGLSGLIWGSLGTRRYVRDAGRRAQARRQPDASRKRIADELENIGDERLEGDWERLLESLAGEDEKKAKLSKEGVAPST